MRSYREELWFETKTRRAFINITPQVEQIVTKSGVQEGLVLVNAMHITASVYINDDEAGLLQDYDRFLERIAPHDDVYRHNETGARRRPSLFASTQHRAGRHLRCHCAPSFAFRAAITLPGAAPAAGKPRGSTTEM